MTLVDEYSEEVCRVWFYLDEHGLELERLNSAGDMPEWLDNELVDTCWDEILGVSWEEGERAAWAIEDGIAPGQPFLVEIRPPHYTQDREGDWDVEYNTDLIRVDPMPSMEAAERWETWLKTWSSVP